MSAQSISSFTDITGADDVVARGFLDMVNGDLEQAVQLFFENPDLQTSFGSLPSRTTPAQDVATPVRRSNPPTSRGGRDVICVDSDDERETQMTLDDDDEPIVIPDDDDDDFEVSAAEAVSIARAAQEEEDAAMAQKLQEELFSENASGAGADPDGVRSPIRTTTETLIAPDQSWGPGGHVEDYGDLLERARRRQGQSRSNQIFRQTIWDDPDQSQQAMSAHERRLAELYRPPFDLISPLPWDDARAEGKEEKKWILVNLQNMSEFHCQILNRDIWKHDAIRELVKENFIFLQYSKDDPMAAQYINFYFPTRQHENPDNYPHVSIVDPRTGEQVKIWSGKPFPTALEFHSQLAEFLDRYSLSDNKKNPVVKTTARRPQAVDFDRMTEDEMLELALQNSLATNGDSSTGRSGVVDPDSLTKSPSMPAKPLGADPLAERMAGQAEEAGSSIESRPTQAEDAFAGISSTNSHAEPDADPATTTRIQFRHATGRVIRRFSLQDPVRRLYEWLKADPLEGKAGVEFELKRMPQGQDLINSLDTTIQDAGLKQGTVMIEFIE